MLKNTKEYAEFGNFVEDSGGNAIRIPASNKENQVDNQEKDESQWVPQDAF